jgi:16S rRNA (guanine527-N7)-methyltransferase
MFHVKHEACAMDAHRAGLSLNAEQWRALRTYEDELRTTAVPRGYIARSDEHRIWQRHILDALRAAPEIPAGADVADLGSGAGVPGVPLATVLPNHVALIEVRRGRVAFLESVVDRLALGNVRVVHGSVESAGGLFGVCLARAFRPVRETWDLAEPKLAPDGSVIYWAGTSFDTSRLDGLGARWRLSAPPDLAEFGPLVIMTRK